jgi:IS1 family transposase
LAYVFGRRKDEVFVQLKGLPEPFKITRFYTDSWGAYTRHLDPEEHNPGKHNTQKIERKHLTLWIRIKRLGRKTICFSKSMQMHPTFKRYPTFKGVWSMVANFAPWPRPDTRHDQCPRPHQR